MNDSSLGAAVVGLLLAGVATAGIAASGVGLPEAGHTLRSLALHTAHWQVLMTLLGAALVLAVFVARLRATAIGVALVAKSSLIAVSLASAPPAAWMYAEGAILAVLVFSGTVFALRARQEARWNGLYSLRPEA
jgi:hypothetical protein